MLDTPEVTGDHRAVPLLTSGPSAPPDLQVQLDVAVAQAPTVLSVLRGLVDVRRRAAAHLQAATPADAYEPASQWERDWWAPYVAATGCQRLDQFFDDVVALVTSQGDPLVR